MLTVYGSDERVSPKYRRREFYEAVESYSILVGTDRNRLKLIVHRQMVIEKSCDATQ
jgi:hypothetical protein